ncbi:hypothetical protein [Bacillus chungangensis]|uniref:Uncharacterized protein n=1 Tax=Bacillus chungangensis TaxID=587633 RepID=A0ABT9WSF2_9BACI|nr:hypothetical protein [Bacillus chungangensis]MDQ0176216.1 hypothetical protein [Bacillus chungangensis]
MGEFIRGKVHSPVAQDFIWVAEYPDGTYLSEFDFETKQENSFYEIKRNQVFRFGLIGHGVNIYFERDGVLNVAGRRLFISYLHDGKELPLNGSFKFNVKDNDLITYKDAHAAGLVSGYETRGGMSSTIVQYNIGYKVNLQHDGIHFHFKPIIKIPLNQPMMLSMRLVADEKLDGQLMIRSNGQTVFKAQAPLEPNIGGELNWIIR